MKPLDLALVTAYVEAHIGSFHQKRLEKLSQLNLQKVLERKNPYLFKAKNVLTAEEFVRSILDAYLSSQEETLFGNFLEGLAIYVCQQVHSAYKPQDVKGIDLIFEADQRLYLVEIKSGQHWGNSSQIREMRKNFNDAKARFALAYPSHEILAINGCCYGKEEPRKADGEYWKLCGQDFWQFVSGDADFYLKIIEPLGHQAKMRNDTFYQAYGDLINRLTHEFLNSYRNSDGSLAWDMIVKLVSQRSKKTRYPFED